MHQNFEVVAGLNYRFTRNLHACVFSTHNTGIMTTSNDFTTEVIIFQQAQWKVSEWD